jgi:hypothetical protein
MRPWSLRSRLLASVALAPDGGGGDGGGDGGGGDGGGQQQQQQQQVQRPDYVPEKFWDGEKRSVRTEELAKSYGGLERILSKRAADLDREDYKVFADAHFKTQRADIEKQIRGQVFGERPIKAGDYKLEIAQAHIDKIPEEMRDLARYNDDPLVNHFREFCFAAGLGQEKFSDMVGGYFAMHAERIDAKKAEEIGKLGENADARIDAVSAFLNEQLGEERLMDIMPLFSSAAGIEAMEVLMERMSGLPGEGGGGSGGNPPAGAKTLEQLKEMQRDKRYWSNKHRDPAFVREVDEGFRKLYPGQVDLSSAIRR